MEQNMTNVQKITSIENENYVDDIRNYVSVVYSKGLFYHVRIDNLFEEWCEELAYSYQSQLTYDEQDRHPEWDLSRLYSQYGIDELIVRWFSSSDITEDLVKVTDWDNNIIE